MTVPLRGVTADDQAPVRAGFRMILTADGVDVVAEATNGAEAVDPVRRTRPEVVLMDIRMPDVDGLEATRRISSPPSAWSAPATRCWRRPSPAASSNGSPAATPTRPRSTAPCPR